MSFLYIKALHIIFIVTWFAALFYTPRLFVYFIEAAGKPDPEKSILQRQFLVMMSRLWFGIAWPSAVITLIIGASLLLTQPAFLKYPYMHIKLVLVVLLYTYHFSLHAILKQLKRDTIKFTSQQMRMWNEAATILLISIVFLVVVKTSLSPIWGIGGLIIITGLILIGIRVYRNKRKDL
jgi:protoporphyrinogen IX oxidase